LQKTVKPQADKLVSKYDVSGNSLPLVQMLIHFRGQGGADFYLEKLKESNGNAAYAQQELDRKYPSKNNMPVENYLKFYR